MNPARPGAAYGYVDMGGWIGGQAEYVMVPYADFNLLKFPDREQAMEKIRDLTCLSDIFPTGYHGAVMAGVKPGEGAIALLLSPSLSLSPPLSLDADLTSPPQSYYNQARQCISQAPVPLALPRLRVRSSSARRA